MNFGPVTEGNGRVSCGVAKILQRVTLIVNRERWKRFFGSRVTKVGNYRARYEKGLQARDLAGTRCNNH